MKRFEKLNLMSIIEKDYNFLPKNLPIPVDDGLCNHLEGMEIPDISLQAINGEYVKLRRKESFKLIFFCYPMTGKLGEALPKNWNNIPGARGCTVQNRSFSDNYDEFTKLNSIPIGITTQSIDEIKEMTNRLKIEHDILSDCSLIFAKSLNLPTFSVSNKVFIKRLTLIVDDFKIIKFFYPIFPPNQHVKEVISWLQKN